MHFSRWTLRSRLIGLTVVLVAVTSILIGGVMAVVIRQTFAANFDNQLQSTAQGVGRAVATNSGISIGQYGVDSGTILGYFPEYGTANGALVRADDSTDLTSAQLSALKKASGATIRPRTQDDGPDVHQPVRHSQPRSRAPEAGSPLTHDKGPMVSGGSLRFPCSTPARRPS